MPPPSLLAPATGGASAGRSRHPRSVGSLGRLPLVASVACLGLVVCAVAEDLSRATSSPSPWIYWAGIATIVAPVVWRLSSTDASAAERLALVCTLGLSLYVVKLMRDPFGFTLSDEFSHAFNVQQILGHHRLFSPNPLLPVTPDYPGLEGATSALATLTGLSSFGAGILVIGAARLTLMVGLFTLFGAVSRSSRVAGLGAAIYAGNSNFLLWNGQFAYESLALPLLVVMLACIAARHAGPRSEVRHWAMPITVAAAAIVPTHHLTSYLMVGLLALIAAIGRLRRWLRATPGVWIFAFIAAAMTAAWLIVIASVTVGYISPVVTAALRSAVRTISGEAPPHALFSGSGVAAGVSNDLAEKIVGVLGILILLAALPFGLRALSRGRREPLTVVLALGAVGYFGVTALRFVPSAWEISNRTAEFLFIGVAFVVASAPLHRLAPGGRRRPGHALLAAGGAIVVVAGAITGWPANSRTAQPLVVTAADGGTIRSEPLGVGRWFARRPDSVVVAPETDAFMIALYGGKTRVLTGANQATDDILTAPTLESWQLALWRRNRVRYVVVDLRGRATDNVTGFYFSLRPSALLGNQFLPPSTATRFDRLPTPRVYDGGDVFVYDLQGRR